MKIIKHGSILKFKCSECGCEFSERIDACHPYNGTDGDHYALTCPECCNLCWTIRTKSTAKPINNLSKRDIIKDAINGMQYVQEYISSICEEHRNTYVDCLEQHMQRLKVIMNDFDKEQSNE